MRWSRQLEGEVRVQSVLRGWQLPKMHGPRNPLATIIDAIAVLEVGGYGKFCIRSYCFSSVSETFVIHLNSTKKVSLLSDGLC